MYVFLVSALFFSAYIYIFGKHPGVSLATRQLRTLLERFANNTSLDLVFNAFQALADDASRDEGLRTWFKAVDLYIRKVLLEPGYVLEPDCNTQVRVLVLFASDNQY